MVKCRGLQNLKKDKNMNTEAQISKELVFQIAQLTYNNAELKVLHENAVATLELFNSILDSDEELKAKFEEVKGKMTNGN
jgi:hypothetical protein|nr:MAG TPA: hypothetical protein [Caudoviricetes sp.]